MKIYPSGRGGPVAGKHFQFNIEMEHHEQPGRIRGKIMLDGEHVEDFECEDPPCYDLYTFISHHRGGAKLVIQATHSSGAVQEVSFRVGSPESSSSPSAAV